jgi:KUP system potassium uptake protein
MATIIASQAVISGAFSVTQQAVQLGFCRAWKIRHTSARPPGRSIFPAVNWALLVLVILLVLGFKSSSNLAAAYGIAVTGTMFITTLHDGMLVLMCGSGTAGWPAAVVGTFLIIDIAYFGANLIKIPDGGWFPLRSAVVPSPC